MKVGAVACGIAVAVIAAVGACDGEIQLGTSSNDGSVTSDAAGDGALPIVFGTCAGDSQCLTTLRCDLPRGACVECRVNGDCSSESPVCLQPAGRCVQCGADSDCEGDHRCGLTTHTCVDACSASQPCSLGTCDVASGHCNECTPGASCADRRVCSPNAQCVACTGDAECSGEQPHCDTTLARCVACTSDSQCGAPKRCDSKSGECKAPAGN